MSQAMDGAGEHKPSAKARRRRKQEMLNALLPNQRYFRIGEVSQLLGVEPGTLRFWETEFPALKQERGQTAHRRYSRRDIETLLEIQHLLRDRRFTIEGARKVMQSPRLRGEELLHALNSSTAVRMLAARIRAEAQALLNELDGADVPSPAAEE